MSSPEEHREDDGFDILRLRVSDPDLRWGDDSRRALDRLLKEHWSLRSQLLERDERITQLEAELEKGKRLMGDIQFIMQQQARRPQETGMADEDYDNDDDPDYREASWEVSPRPTPVVVPHLAGCCQHCGRSPTITMEPVNQTVCIGIIAHKDCKCVGKFNLWPVAPYARLPECL